MIDISNIKNTGDCNFITNHRPMTILRPRAGLDFYLGITVKFDPLDEVSEQAVKKGLYLIGYNLETGAVKEFSKFEYPLYSRWSIAAHIVDVRQQPDFYGNWLLTAETKDKACIYILYYNYYFAPPRDATAEELQLLSEWEASRQAAIEAESNLASKPNSYQEINLIPTGIAYGMSNYLYYSDYMSSNSILITAHVLDKLKLNNENNIPFENASGSADLYIDNKKVDTKELVYGVANFNWTPVSGIHTMCIISKKAKLCNKINVSSKYNDSINTYTNYIELIQGSNLVTQQAVISEQQPDKTTELTTGEKYNITIISDLSNLNELQKVNILAEITKEKDNIKSNARGKAKLIVDGTHIANAAIQNGKVTFKWTAVSGYHTICIKIEDAQDCKQVNIPYVQVDKPELLKKERAAALEQRKLLRLQRTNTRLIE